MNRELVSLLDMYIKIGWCKKFPNELKQYKAFKHAVDRFCVQKEEILRNIIHTVPGLKVYMMLHSVFRVRAAHENDWFVKFMIRELQPTDEEIEIVTRTPHIPEEYLEKLKAFDPEPVGLVLDNVRLEYELWGNPSEGGSPMPIHIIDTDWEKVEHEAPPDPEKFIASYEEIDAEVISKEVYSFNDDDLPF